MRKMENIVNKQFYENICQYILPSNTLSTYASGV